MNPDNYYADVSDLQLLSAVNNSSMDNVCSKLHNTNTILGEQNATMIETMSGNERLIIAVDKNVKESGLSIQSSIERNSKLNNDVTYRTASELVMAVERNGGKSTNATESLGSSLESSVERTSGYVKLAQQKIAVDTRHILATNHVAAALLGKDEQLDILKTKEYVKIQASKYFNQTELRVQEVQSELELRSVKNTSAIQLEAIRNKIELETGIESCLCDLKTQVVSTASFTQKTARDLESARIRDALNDAMTEKLINRLKKTVNC